MKINYKKLQRKARTPFYASEGAAAVDLVAISKKTIEEKEYGYIEYGTGIAIEIPKGYVGKIYPRSSVRNTGMFFRNSVGIIDSDYRGEIKVTFAVIRGMGDYKAGERIAQMIIEPIEQIEFNEVEELTETIRDDKGHGSTGN
jgi:dUTP pyrophosphatase